MKRWHDNELISQTISQANIKLLILTINIVAIGCLTAVPVSFNDPLQRIQQEMEQLKRSNEESISAMKTTYDEKIASLEQQLRRESNVVPQSGLVSSNL